jgi:hypothetical protein
MTELNSKVEQVASAVQKAIAEQAERYQTAVAELGKLQSKSVAQANAFVETMTHAAHEQIAFAQQLGAEWRKLVLAATRNAAGILDHKV